MTEEIQAKGLRQFKRTIGNFNIFDVEIPFLSKYLRYNGNRKNNLNEFLEKILQAMSYVSQCYKQYAEITLLDKVIVF